MGESTNAAFIHSPPPDVAGWTALLQDREIPVLQATSLAIEELRGIEDSVDAQLLAGAVVDDPLMTLKLLKYVGLRRSRRAVSDAETVLSAVVMLGISPFFSAFSLQPTVESRLAEDPEALDGLRGVLRRAHRAARFALGFAVHRMDHDAAVIHEAALLHDFAEMLVWVHAPELAKQVARRQQADPELRSTDAQLAVLNVVLSDLQLALMRAWRLPEMLVQISDDQRAGHSSQVRNVLLAIRVARHSAGSWGNPALPDDLAELGALLNLTPPHVQQLLSEIDA